MDIFAANYWINSARIPMTGYNGFQDCNKWYNYVSHDDWNSCPGYTPTLDGMEKAKRILDVRYFIHFAVPRSTEHSKILDASF